MAPKKKYKILIAEDDYGTSVAIEEHLSMAGFSIVCAYTGKDALIAFEEDPDIKLVLMDGKMAYENDGFEAAETIKHDYDPPIICISSDPIPDEYQEHFLAHYPKPINFKEMLVFIKKTLKKS